MDMVPTVWETKEDIDNLDFTKIKNFFGSYDIIKTMKRKPTKCRSLVNHTSGKS